MKVYRLNDYEWWMSESLDQVIEAAYRTTGVPPNEVACDARELRDAELDKLILLDLGRAPGGSGRTFREELARLVENGDTVTQLFAMVE